MHSTLPNAFQAPKSGSNPRSDRPGSPSISLILPAWNESDVIESAIEEADHALREIADVFEIIIVDDGSTDDTASKVLAISKSNPSVKLVRHSPNQGYGAALRSGFDAARMDLVAFTDADCQFDLSELDRFVLLARRYQVVCGYRIDRKDTPLRCLYSKVYNLLVRFFLGTGVRDVDCALKMFHRDVVKQMKITGNGFLVNSELLVQAHQRKHSVVEVGVSHRPRTLGTSTVSISHIPKVLSALARYWWNEVQFPADCDATGRNSADRDSVAKPSAKFSGAMQLGLLLIASVFLLTNLGYPLIDRDETRYAEIPREMIATGNWVLPQLNFQTYYDKPPLLYWLCAISFKLFGISETSARLVPALAALGTLALTMFFGSKIFNRRIGLISGVVLMLSVGFAFTSRYLLLDGVLSFFVAGSLFTAFEAIRANASSAGRSLEIESETTRGKAAESGSAVGTVPQVRLGWWVLSAVFVGLALLTKGPLALVLWMPPVMAFSWLSQGCARPKVWHYGLLGLIAVAITAPWLVAVTRQDPNFLWEFLVTHNVTRFAGGFHERPIWYFIPVLLVAGHPWSFLTLPYARFLFGRSEEVRRQRPRAIGFLLLWSVWAFVFFSISKCKLPTYLLPAAPAMAMVVGHYLNEVLRGAANSSQHFFARFWSARSATATTCLAGVGFVIFVMLTIGQATFLTYAWAVIWTSLLVSSLLLMKDRHQAKFAWATSSGVAFLFVVMLMHQMVPAFSRSMTLLGETSPLSGDAIDWSESAVATVDHEFSEVPFYLNRSNVQHFGHYSDPKLAAFVAANSRCILILESGVSASDVHHRLPSGTHMTRLGERGIAAIYEATLPPEKGRLARSKQDANGEVRR